MQRSIKKHWTFLLALFMRLSAFSVGSMIEIKAAPSEILAYTETADIPHLITNKYELASIGNMGFGRRIPTGRKLRSDTGYCV